MQKRVKVCVRVRPTTSKDFDTTNSNETIAISEAVVIDEQQQVVCAQTRLTLYAYDAASYR